MEDDNYENFDFDNIIEKLYKDSEILDPAGIPLDPKSKEFKNFQKNFSIFWKELFSSSSSLVFESDLIEKYTSWLEKISQ